MARSQGDFEIYLFLKDIKELKKLKISFIHWRADDSKDEQSANCISHKDIQNVILMK